MRKTVLLISELLQDLNRMKDWFPSECTIKGINSFTAVPNALRSELPDMICLRIRNLEDFFQVYEQLRTSVNYADTPVVAIADIGLQADLAHNVSLKGVRVVGSSVTDGNMIKIVNETLKELEEKA